MDDAILRLDSVKRISIYDTKDDDKYLRYIKSKHPDQVNRIWLASKISKHIEQWANIMEIYRENGITLMTEEEYLYYFNMLNERIGKMTGTPDYICCYKQNCKNIMYDKCCWSLITIVIGIILIMSISIAFGVFYHMKTLEVNNDFMIKLSYGTFDDIMSEPDCYTSVVINNTTNMCSDKNKFCVDLLNWLNIPPYTYYPHVLCYHKTDTSNTSKLFLYDNLYQVPENNIVLFDNVKTHLGGNIYNIVINKIVYDKDCYVDKKVVFMKARYHLVCSVIIIVVLSLVEMLCFYYYITLE
jgi:hypothetical protein